MVAQAPARLVLRLGPHARRGVLGRVRGQGSRRDRRVRRARQRLRRARRGLRPLLAHRPRRAARGGHGPRRQGALVTNDNGSRRGVHETTTLESPLAATWRPRVPEKAVLVGVGRGIEDADLDELAALADSAGAEPVARVLQTRQDPNPATFVGRGKIEEVHQAVHRNGAEAVILDDELTPGQLRNLEERLKVKVIDRTALILDIFALHARSREGKAQVELAQLNYLLPRLRGWGEAMSRSG